MSHLLPGLEKACQSRSASCGHFELPHTSPAPGQADLMIVVPGHGLEDRQRHLSGWLEPSAERRAVALPTACLLHSFLFLKDFRKLQRFREISLSPPPPPFLESMAKYKESIETKPSPQSRVCRCDANQHPGL